MDNESKAKERVLDVAERLFNEKGYKGVRLKDIADALGIRQASLYYHVPGGKESLYVEVMERGFKKHREQLEQVAQQAGPDLQAKLQAVSRWLLKQPPINFSRMVASDMPSISETHAQRLMAIGYQSVLLPVENIFMEGAQTEDLQLPQMIVLAGSFLSIVSAIQHSPTNPTYEELVGMTDEMIDVLLNGIRKR